MSDGVSASNRYEDPLGATMLRFLRGIVRVLFFTLLVCTSAEVCALNLLPEAGGTLDSRNAQCVVSVGGWVDYRACQVDVTENGKVIQSLVPASDSEPDVRATSAPALPPGRCQLRWLANAVRACLRLPPVVNVRSVGEDDNV